MIAQNLGKKIIRVRTEWKELDILEYIEVTNILRELTELEKECQQVAKEVEKITKEYVKSLSETNKELQKKLVAQMKEKNETIESYQQEIQTQNINLSCILGIGLEKSDFAKMFSCSLENGNYNEGCIQFWTDKNILLINQELPNEKINSFKFQFYTDEEMGKLNWWRRNQKGIKAHEYKIRDIWEHPTLLNKFYQEMAQHLSKKINQGDYSALPDLVALLTANEDLDRQLSELVTDRKNNKTELQNLFVKATQYRKKVFTEQKIKLSCTVAIGVCNFFLSKLPT